MAKQTPFQKFEALAQQLVEGSFNRFLGKGLTLSDIAMALARSAEAKAVSGVVPAQYEIRLNPAVFDQLVASEPDAAAALTEYLRTFVRQAALSFSGVPHLSLIADPAVELRVLQVEAVTAERPSEQTITQMLPQAESPGQFAAEIAALDAYLIVDGQRHVPLNKPVTHLGRQIDNDVVLDDPTVSRKHAQIRWRYGRFILYDVSRRGRTQVNNQPVNETVLQSGDVISLSDTKLIYGEGETQPRPRSRNTNNLNDETQIRPPSNP